MDVNNFETYTFEEYSDNLNRLGISSYSELVGESVYYARPSYGVHEVVEWYPDRGEYLLDLDGDCFYSTPFSLIRMHI